MHTSRNANEVLMLCQKAQGHTGTPEQASILGPSYAVRVKRMKARRFELQAKFNYILHAKWFTRSVFVKETIQGPTYV